MKRRSKGGDAVKKLQNDAGKVKNVIFEDAAKLKTVIVDDANKLKDAITTDTPLGLQSVSYIEKLSQKRGADKKIDERFTVVPSYNYPNTRMNRDELRKEMNAKSSYFHELRLPQEEKGVGQLSVEILQCFGIPKPDLLSESSAFCVLVSGQHAFKTDVMPPVANPIWLRKMRRACVFPIFHAYASLYIGVFGQAANEKAKDGFAGRIVVDIARLRPNCTYDVTLPLRQSAQVYSRQQRGALRLRFHLKWYSERRMMLSYLPKTVPKIEPNESVRVRCCDAKSFQNVARVVHGNDMPGKFSAKQARACIREINFTRIHILRYLRKRETRNLTQWRYPVISGFVFLAWMHSVYKASIAYVPGHLLTYLLLHLWKNYARYAHESPVQNGFLAPTWEEMFAALLLGADDRNCIEPLEMEMKNESSAKSALQDMATDSFRSLDETSVPLKDIAEAFRRGVKVKNHRYHLKMYHNVFRGTDAVDFLVNGGFAKSREEAVAVGSRLADEMKLFEHVARRQGFKDEALFYVFLTYDTGQYSIKTHKPLFRTVFHMLGFWPEFELTEAEAHLEMPYSDGIDHPRFTVKESLVIRSKSSQRLLIQEHEVEESDSKTQSQSQAFTHGLGEFLDEDDEDDNESDEGGPGGDHEEDNGIVTEIEILNKPPQQRMEFVKRGDRKLPEVMAEARHKVHGVLLHLFNDRTYKIETSDKASTQELAGSVSKVARTRTLVKSVSKFHHRKENPQPKIDSAAKKSSVAAKKDEYNKLLGSDKYSHGNPWISKLGLIVQPIVEIAVEWLCLFRALFNLFSWRDPILSFWVSIICPFVIIILHLFPWRWVMAIVGLALFGPQNWLLRILRERKEDYELDLDTIVKKKRLPQEVESCEHPMFSNYTPNNRPIQQASLGTDASDLRQIVVPCSQLHATQRFYDWPPENEYARVIAEEAPKSDPEVNMLMQSLSAEDEKSIASSRKGKLSSWGKARRALTGGHKLRLRKKNAT